MLPPSLLCALFTRNVLEHPLFDSPIVVDNSGNPTLRLSIRFGRFSTKMTLAAFVHQVGLFFDRPLTLKHFGKPPTYLDDYKNINQKFVDRENKMGRDAYYIETILRSLQLIAIEASLKTYASSQNLIEHVFKQLIDYLDKLAKGSKGTLKALKARLTKITNRRIARVGIEAMLLQTNVRTKLLRRYMLIYLSTEITEYTYYVQRGNVYYYRARRLGINRQNNRLQNIYMPLIRRPRHGQLRISL